MVAVGDRTVNGMGHAASAYCLWLYCLGVALSMLVLGFMAFRLLIKDKVSPSSSRKRAPAKVTGHEVTYRLLKTHLRSRHSLFWRNKVRLLLITGGDAAIEQLIPGLKHHQWLEGNRTVLIYGGSLTTEPDKEKYTALRKLRRGRPLDGIVRVVPQSLNLTPQISDNDLRGLEKSASCCVIPPRSGCGSCATASGRRQNALNRR